MPILALAASLKNDTASRRPRKCSQSFFQRRMSAEWRQAPGRRNTPRLKTCNLVATLPYLVFSKITPAIVNTGKAGSIFFQTMRTALVDVHNAFVIRRQNWTRRYEGSRSWDIVRHQSGWSSLGDSNSLIKTFARYSGL